MTDSTHLRRAWLPLLVFVLAVANLVAGSEKVCDGQQAPVMRDSGLHRGVNFGNMLEAPNEGDWGLFVEEAFFDRVVEAGFDHIRLPVSWTGHAGLVPPYTIDPAFMERVAWCVDQAEKRRLAIIVNNHHYDALNSDPLGERDRALAIWQQIAERFQFSSPRVYFEVLNEPHGAFNDNPQLWNDFLRDAVEVIRASNPRRRILAGPVGWNAISALDSFDPPRDRWLIATVHNYEPFAFTHQGAEWVDPIPPVGVTWNGVRKSIGAPWQNWSWGTTVANGDDGLTVSWDSGWAGLFAHSGYGSVDVQQIVFTVDEPLSVTVYAGNDDENQSHTVQTGAGTQQYTVNLTPMNGPVTDVFLQNNSPAAQAPFLLGQLDLVTAAGTEKIVISEAEASLRLMQSAAQWANARRMPMYLGEFGAYEKGDLVSRVAWTATVRSQAEQLNIGWGYWEFGAGFGVYDPDSDAFLVALLQALIP